VIRASIGACLCLALAVPAGFARAQSCPNEIPHLTGTWTILPYEMPVNPVSTTLLHDGTILIIAGSEADQNNHNGASESYRAAIWDPTGVDEGSIAVQNLEYDVFCSGTAVAPHGRALIVGGTSDYTYTGDNRASFFDPATGEFNQTQNMADGRWYGTATVLGDGRVMAISGLRGNAATNATVEIYDLAHADAGWGVPIAEPFTPPLFPREFLLPDGRVFFTGQGAGPSISRAYIFDPVAKTWALSIKVTVRRDYGSAVLLPLLPPAYTPRVMNFGGGSPTKRTTEIVDLSQASPTWVAGPDMSTRRIEMNAVLLPNGKVLAEGGSVNDEAPDGPGKTADLYDPVSNTMSSGGTAAYSRLYHSNAILLPDARVISVGSNPGDRGSYQPAIEIYTPPYLFDASDRPVSTRPVITGVSPSVLGYGATFSVTYTGASAIASAVLMRPGSATHAFDMDQRAIGLCGLSPQPACTGPGTLSLTTPPSGNLAPPGFYMLFLLDSAGVPSKAQWVELTPHAAAPPTGAIASPAADATIAAGGTVTFATDTVASKYAWVFPGGSPASSSAQTPGAVTYADPGEYAASLTVIDAAGDSDPSPPTRTIVVLPATADFDLTVSPPASTATPGSSAQFTVNVIPLQGFTGTVTLDVSSESGFPTGVASGGFDPPTITGAGSSTLTMDTTTDAIPYAVSLTVTGTSGANVHAASTSLVIALAPPGGLMASASSGQVALSWMPTTGATGYQVQRATVAGGPYEAIACPAVTAYTDSAVANGTTSYYVVSASYAGGPDAGGRSADSAEVAATPACPVPAHAGLLTASKSGAATSWDWTAGGAVAFDLVRGDLMTLRGTGGDLAAAIDAIPAGEQACLANDTGELTLADPSADPPPDGGFFALIRAVATVCPAAGSYDDDSPLAEGSRDPAIAASSRSCP
jgi:Galactose oxidase-like, Early set domain/PKD domain